MNLGVPEIIVILAIALLFFGPSRLPSLGKSIGEAIRGFKKGMSEDSAEDKKERIVQDSSKKAYHTENETAEHKEKS
jgi:sec-independent protein translocase protein TatA